MNPNQSHRSAKSTLSALTLAALLAMAHPLFCWSDDLAPASQQTVVPRLINFSGVVKDAAGKPLSGAISITFSLYSQQQGATPVWSERQTVQADAAGKYTAILGTSSRTGLPVELFASGSARWLQAVPDIPGVPDPDRVLLVGVPYALKAADADTLGGKPASAFLTASAASSQADPALTAGPAAPQAAVAGGGTENYLPIWTDSATLGNSILYQSAGKLGIGTTAPSTQLSVNGSANVNTTYSDTNASLTVGTASSALYNLNLFNPSTSKRRSAILFSGNSSAPKPYFELGSDLANTGTNSFFLFDKQANLYRWVVDGNGNMGVGTSSPTATLEVNGTARFDGLVSFAGGINDTGNITSSAQLVSNVATGTAPLKVSSTTQVPNLNASYLGGQAASAFGQLAAANIFTNTNTFSAGISATTVSTNAPSFSMEAVAHNDTNGNAAIWGIATGSTAQTIGVEGTTSSPAGTGIFGGETTRSHTGSINSNGAYSGVWADTSSAGTSALTATTDDGYAGFLINNSASKPTVLIQAMNTGNVAEFDGTTGYCTIDTHANLSCTGSKSAVVPVDDGARKVALYAVEAPENWFEDFGSAKLAAGRAVIHLEPTFKQTVNVGLAYHVFITPRGESKGLYVTNTSAEAFEVRETSGGKSNIEFDYRIVARRKGYEYVRLADLSQAFASRARPAHKR